LETSVYVDRPEAAQELAHHEIRLEKFSGPLDLLLYLIRKEELDIRDIPIARITKQYLDQLDIMRAFDLEVAGEYILMAATLIRIKAQMLLPRPESESDEEDPRGALVAALLEYQQFKEASGVLHGYESEERRRFMNPGNMPAVRVEESLPQDVGLYDLVSVMGEMLHRARADAVHEVETEPYSVEEQMECIRAALSAAPSALLSAIVGPQPGRALIVATFLALLELTRMHIIALQQVARYGDIRIIGRRMGAPVSEGETDA